MSEFIVLSGSWFRLKDNPIQLNGKAIQGGLITAKRMPISVYECHRELTLQVATVRTASLEIITGHHLSDQNRAIEINTEFSFNIMRPYVASVGLTCARTLAAVWPNRIFLLSSVIAGWFEYGCAFA